MTLRYAMTRNTTENLKRLMTEQTYLVEQLDKALAIEHLWHTAFDYGDVKSQWIPNPVKRSRLDQRLNPGAHVGETFIITNAMGDVKKFLYDDVPHILGGGKVVSGVAAAKE